jgi:exodeoxyribonuclease VII large subunit
LQSHVGAFSFEHFGQGERKQVLKSVSTDQPFDFDPSTGTSQPPRNIAEYTVSELSFALKRTLEEAYGYVRVRAEIGRVTNPGSGHCYFDLKDDRCVISAVMWKSSFSRLRIKPQQGLEVVVTGKVTTFPGQSKYQILVESLEPAGVGALMALLDDRKKKLAAEGLFDQARKKPLPFLPRVIGVVTSPTGAVIRDILHRLEARFPRQVIVWPVRVQGDQCAREVATGIRGFNALEGGGPIPRPDLIIVARGGGSIEDLWGFNEEIVVRAAAESRIPLISAVGHETDWTLLDHAADHRAPTPTAAAERAVPVRADLVAHLASLAARQRRCTAKLMDDRHARLLSAGRGLPKPDEILGHARQRFDAAGGRLAFALKANTRHHRADLARCAARLSLRPVKQDIERKQEYIVQVRHRMKRAVSQHVAHCHRSVEATAKLLATLSHRSVLKRGFALVVAEGKLVASAAGARPGQHVSLEFHDGAVGARIDRKDSVKTKSFEPQGTLF